MQKVMKIYEILMEEYGPQGWWPILSHKGTNPTKAGSIKGYHVGDYSFPKTRGQQFEICAGAILTQNTSWPSVETALVNLKRARLLTPDAIYKAEIEKIGSLIRPAGYFNQKSRYLKNFTGFFISLGKHVVPKRDQVLAIKGVGDETADSILLFAFMQPEFIVDAYTRRIFSRIGLIDKAAAYGTIKDFFQDKLEPDIAVYQEYHALIVEHAKRHCRTRPDCTGCPLKRMCKQESL